VVRGFSDDYGVEGSLVTHVVKGKDVQGFAIQTAAISIFFSG
jgi:hypothetical protein